MNLPKSLRNLLRRFRLSEKGAIAILFALLLIPMLVATGVAVDFLRGSQAKSALQAAVDSAALAGAADPNLSLAEIQQVTQRYLDQNPAGAGVDVDPMSPVVDPVARTVTYEVTGVLPTTFMKVVGIDNMNIGARAVVRRGQQGPVDMVLVLDQTNSMTETLSGTKTKIQALREASNALVDSVMTTSEAKVGLVPFTSFVNLAMTYSGEPWLAPNPPRTICTYSPECYKPCTVDGAPGQCVDTTLPGCTSTCTTQNWSGCVSHRTEGWRDTILSPTDPKYPGVFAGCATGVLKLSNVKSSVKSRINTMGTIQQNTFIPMGLVWGWNMLTSDEPLTEARSKAAMQAVGGKFALVLVSDGASTVYPNPSNSGTYLPYSSGTVVANGQDPITLTQNLCTNIKNDGIEVYTVRVKVADPATDDLLIDCASDSRKTYNVQNTDDLNEAFKNIGAQLKDVKLVE